MAYLAEPTLYDMPEEIGDYWLFRVARWAGVPAWELLNRPAGWYEGYKSAMEIESRLMNFGRQHDADKNR